MIRTSALLAALLVSTAAFAQSIYPPGSIPFTATASGTTGVVTASIAAQASKTAVICGFYYSGTNATAAQTGSVTVVGVVGGTMSFGYPTLALGATIPTTIPIDEAFLPCIPATSVNVAITVNGPALGAGATLATVTAWGFYQ
jgi:hypothetical protein